MVLKSDRRISNQSDDILKYNMTTPIDYRFRIPGISCVSCVVKFEAGFRSFPYVIDVAVNLLTKCVVITATSNTKESEFAAMFTEMGYDSVLLQKKPKATTYDSGVTVSERSVATIHLSWEPTKAFDKILVNEILGVVSSIVSNKRQYVKIYYDANVVGSRALLEEIRNVTRTRVVHVSSTNPKAEMIIDDYFGDDEDALDRQRSTNLLHILIASIACCILIYIVEFFRNYFFFDSHKFYGWSYGSVIIFTASSFVQLLSEKTFQRAGRAALYQNTPDMNSLIAIATSILYYYSIFAFLYNRFNSEGMVKLACYFDTSASLITIVVFGRYLEDAAKRRTLDAIEELKSRQTGTANRLEIAKDNSMKESLVSIELLEHGDLLFVRAGERIPVDGRVCRNITCTVDESLLTGESLSVSKSHNDIVYEGSTVIDGFLTLEVSQVGSQSFVGQMTSSIRNIKMKKSKAEIYADAVARVFVPTVLILSLMTTAIWGLLIYFQVVVIPPHRISDSHFLPFEFGIAVLSIACPCALGLATPTAIVVAAGVAAKHGVFIRAGMSFEVATRIHTVILDKTGTVTEGSPAVVDNINVDESLNFWRYVGTAEQGSSHPIAKALYRHAQKILRTEDKFTAVAKFRNLIGTGVECEVDGIRTRVSNTCRPKNNVEANSEAFRRINAWAEPKRQYGDTVVFVEVGDKCVGAVSLRDGLKAGSKAAIRSLRGDLHLDVWMCSGDNEVTSSQCAAAAGIIPLNVFSSATPQDKCDIVRRFKADPSRPEDSRVCFVGDGMNDTLALAESDVGVAMGTGANMAMDTADVVLVHSSLSDFVKFLQLSHLTKRTIRRNYCWAVIFNAMALPLAAGCLYRLGIIISPPLAGALMAGSSLKVVMSSLSIRDKI